MQGVETASGNGRTFVSINELARTLGVTPAPVSRRVAKLEGQGLIETRRKGQRKLVDLEAYMSTVKRVEDGVRAANGRLAAPGRSAGSSEPHRPVARSMDTDLFGDPVLAVEQARKARADADLKELQLEQRRGWISSRLSKAAGRWRRMGYRSAGWRR